MVHLTATEGQGLCKRCQIWTSWSPVTCKLRPVMPCCRCQDSFTFLVAVETEGSNIVPQRVRTKLLQVKEDTLGNFMVFREFGFLITEMETQENFQPPHVPATTTWEAAFTLPTTSSATHLATTFATRVNHHCNSCRHNNTNIVRQLQLMHRLLLQSIKLSLRRRLPLFSLQGKQRRHNDDTTIWVMYPCENLGHESEKLSSVTCVQLYCTDAAWSTGSLCV